MVAKGRALLACVLCVLVAASAAPMRGKMLWRMRRTQTADHTALLELER
jgi:hypothetical protein